MTSQAHKKLTHHLIHNAGHVPLVEYHGTLSILGLLVFPTDRDLILMLLIRSFSATCLICPRFRCLLFSSMMVL